MEVTRDYYLNKLIKKRHNGLAKIITGIRRCGKSYLLFNLFYDYLIKNGINKECIIEIQLDEIKHAKYRNPLELDNFIKSKIVDSEKQYYVFIDEIQLVENIINPWLETNTIGFVDVILGLIKIKNLDVYITGSNSKMLSNDIVTQFRDRGSKIHLAPLSYSEYCRAVNEESEATWQDYLYFGGLPGILKNETEGEKKAYLIDVFQQTYLKDVLERNDIRNDKYVIDELVGVIASSIGSLSNPNKIANTYLSVSKLKIKSSTVALYLDYLEDAFIISKASRFDIKGRKHIGGPLKYYFTDIGIRNATLNYRQQEENHIMENVIYNELRLRGYSVDVGMVINRYINSAGKDVKSQLEVDFIATSVNTKIYIQSALHVDTIEKRNQEIKSLQKIDDSFKKIVVVKDNVHPWIDDYGIHYIGIRELLSGSYIDFEMV